MNCRAVAGALVLCIGLFTVRRADAILIFMEDFEAGTAGADLDTLAGWALGAEGGRQIIESDGTTKFATTSAINNSASRYDFAISNPGLIPGARVIMAMDVFDPSTNPGGVSTFPRAYGGLMQSGGAAGMPVYVGIEHDDASADSGIAEWVAAGENFSPRHFGVSDTLPQDAWFTVRGVWNLGTQTMDVFAKTRDGADPFVPVLLGVSTPFVAPDQDLVALDVWRQRLNRGTRIDNISVEVVPEPTGWLIMIGVVIGTLLGSGHFRRRLVIPSDATRLP